MNANRWMILFLAAAFMLQGLSVFGRSEEKAKPETGAAGKKTEEPQEAEEPRMTLEQARDRAELLHDTYEATLRTIHRYYFREGEVTIPSRALEDIFFRVSRRSKIDARWLAVNANAMSIEHEAKSGFDKEVVKALRKEDVFEKIENGEYHRAGAITLFSGCTRCHTSNAKRPVAALVITMPVATEEIPVAIK